MMTRFSRHILSILAAGALAACGSSPPVNYYNLEPVAAGTSVVKTDVPILSVGPLRVPEYLSRPQLVTRGPGSSMIIDDFNRWAEPLDHSIHRVVSGNIDNLMDRLIVVAFPTSSLIDVNYRLLGTIERFDVDEGGQAVLVVQWGVGDTEGTSVVPARRSRYTATASSGSSDATVRAMAEVISRFSQDVANEMASVVASD